jgi:aryl-alcohol dehydrogenase-like predicted oxidoreductase
VFRFAQQVGMLPLTGTTDVNHMREDLASAGFQLTDDEVGSIESIAAR